MFAMVKDSLTNEIRKESPWTVLFGDDVVISCENWEEIWIELEEWMDTQGLGGREAIRAKTEYPCLDRDDGKQLGPKG